MLKGIDPIVSADLLWVLQSMGHGDELVLCDRNFPARSVALDTQTQRLIELPTNTNRAAEAILSLFPLDSFVEAPIQRMEVVGNPGELLEVHRDLQAIADAAEGRAVTMGAIERMAFYTAARRAYAVVQTAEDRPYGCFILKKGVVFG